MRFKAALKRRRHHAPAYAGAWCVANRGAAWHCMSASSMVAMV